MNRIPRYLAAEGLVLMTAITLAPRVRGASTVVLDVPQLAPAGSARGFRFVSFQFNLYLVPVGVPDSEESDSDYSANVLANDDENYTYEHAGGGGSGRGGGYKPPTYVRGPGNSYSATYQNVTRPPGNLDAFFHFSGADVAGMPLDVAVLESGTYSLTLTADADETHSPIAPGTPLSNSLYTLEYQTDSLLGSQITFTGAASRGDFNLDGEVDGADFLAWQRGESPNGPGAADLATWQANFGLGTQFTASSTPEPSAVMLALLAAAARQFAMRRRSET